jgi:hypothetical protein
LQFLRRKTMPTEITAMNEESKSESKRLTVIRVRVEEVETDSVPGSDYPGGLLLTD